MRVQVLNLGGLKQVDCLLPEAGVVCVVGKNGAGKSTLLRAVAGLLARDKNPAELSPRIRKDWLGHNGASPVFSLVARDDSWEISQSALEQATRGDPPLCHPWAVGLEDILSMKPADRLTTLEGLLLPKQVVTTELPYALAAALLGGSPSREEMDSAMATDLGMAEEIRGIMEVLHDQQDWSGLLGTFENRRRDARTRWEETFGEGINFGKVQSANARPGNWRDELEESTPAIAAQKVVKAQEARDDLISRQSAANEAERQAGITKRSVDQISAEPVATPAKGLTEAEQEEFSGLPAQISLEASAIASATARPAPSPSSGELLKKLEDQQKKRSQWGSDLSALSHWESCQKKIGQLKDSIKELESGEAPQEVETLELADCPACDTSLVILGPGKGLQEFVPKQEPSELAGMKEELGRLQAIKKPEDPGEEPVVEDDLLAKAREAGQQEEERLEAINKPTQEKNKLEARLGELQEKAAKAGSSLEEVEQRKQDRKNRLDVARSLLEEMEAEAKEKRKAAPTDEALEEATQALRQAHEDERMVKVVKTCASHYQDWQHNDAIVGVLGPNGWRNQRINQELKVVRAVMKGCSSAAGFELCELDQDYELSYGGRPWKVISASEQFRARLAFRIGLARATNSPVVCIDACDILDPGSLHKLVTEALEPMAERRSLLLLVAATSDQPIGSLCLELEDGHGCPMAGPLSSAV